MPNCAIASLSSRPVRENCRPPKPIRTFAIPVPFISFKRSTQIQTDADLKLTHVAILRVLHRIITTPKLRKNRHVFFWFPYKKALIRYGICVAEELQHRGYQETSLKTLKDMITVGYWSKPPFMKRENYQQSCREYLTHRSMRRYAITLIHWLQRRGYVPDWTLKQLCNDTGIELNELDTYRLEDLKHIVLHASSQTRLPISYVKEYPWDVSNFRNCIKYEK